MDVVTQILVSAASGGIAGGLVDYILEKRRERIKDKPIRDARKDLILFISNIISMQKKNGYDDFFANIGPYRTDRLNRPLDGMKLMSIRRAGNGALLITERAIVRELSEADIKKMIRDIKAGLYDQYFVNGE